MAENSHKADFPRAVYTADGLPGAGPSLSQEEFSKAIFLHEGRFTRDPLVQPEPEYEFDQRVTW